jgi:hypothetical protein
MKKNKSKLLIPLIGVVVLILVLGGVLLRDNILKLFKPKDSFTKTEGFPREIDTDMPVAKTRRIIKSEAEYKALVKELFGDENKMPMPENDFEKNDLFVVTTELNSTKGFKFKVKSIIKDETKNEYQAVVERQKPGKNCMNATVTNVVVDVVKVDKNITDIEFDRVDKIVDCK